MSRTRRYLSGLAGNYLNQAVVLLLGLWLTRFLLQQLPQEEYGLWLIVVQVLTFLELTDLGVVALLPREVAYRTGRADGPEEGAAAVSALLDGVRRITLWQLPLVATAAVGLWVMLLGGRLDHPAALPLATAVLGYIVLFPLRLYAATLQGLQDLLFLALANTVVWLAQTAATVILVLTGWGFWSLVGGWVLGRALSTLVCWARVRTAFPGVVPRRVLGRNMADAPKLVRSGLWVSAAGLAVGLQYGADVLVLGHLLGPGPVVVYACTMRLIALCTFQVCGLVTLAGPALSELREREPGERLVRASAALGQLILLASGFVACVLLVGNEGFVTWWVGPSRYGGAPLTWLLLAVMVTRHASFTFAQVLLYLGHERSLALGVLADGLVVVGTTVLLAPPCGLLAAPLGSLVGVALVSLPWFGLLLAREPNFSLRSLLRAYLPWAWRFALLAAGLGALSTLWGPQDLVGVGLSAVAIGVLYGLVMLPALVRTPLWVYLQPRLATLRDRVRGLKPKCWLPWGRAKPREPEAPGWACPLSEAGKD
jgi:O-antigen/teichoic acid export membrane protein